MNFVFTIPTPFAYHQCQTIDGLSSYINKTPATFDRQLLTIQVACLSSFLSSSSNLQLLSSLQKTISKSGVSMVYFYFQIWRIHGVFLFPNLAYPWLISKSGVSMVYFYFQIWRIHGVFLFPNRAYPRFIFISKSGVSMVDFQIWRIHGLFLFPNLAYPRFISISKSGVSKVYFYFQIWRIHGLFLLVYASFLKISKITIPF